MITRRKLTKEDLERMNLPPAFWRAKVETVPEAVNPQVVAYLAKLETVVAKAAGLLITGASGVGKTGIASLVLKEARACGYTGFFIPVWEFRESIRAKLQFDNDVTIYARAKEVDFLILDGLEKEDLKDPYFGTKHLGDLISLRGANNKITIVTTALDPEFLAELDGFLPKIKGCMVLFPVEGPDLRQEQQAAIAEEVFSVEGPNGS